MIEEDLSQYAIFSKLDADQRRLVASHCEEITVEPFQLIFANDQDAEYLHLVKEGKVVIQYEPATGHTVEIYTVEKGMVLGWSGIVYPFKYTGDAFSEEPARLIRIKG